MDFSKSQREGLWRNRSIAFYLGKQLSKDTKTKRPQKSDSLPVNQL